MESKTPIKSKLIALKAKRLKVTKYTYVLKPPRRTFRIFNHLFFQIAHRERGALGPARRGGRVAELPERPLRLRAELLPGPGGGPGARRRCPQDLPVCVH